MTFEAWVNLIQAYIDDHHLVIFVWGAMFGFLLHIITLKLHIWRLRKQSRNRNMIVIQSRNKSAAKTKTNVQYYNYINNAQYKSGKWQG